ncbi:MAG TPA: MFS transporter [Gemmataceae bacterium]|nr:MFS transporter [Gemmataceae bacterium]
MNVPATEVTSPSTSPLTIPRGRAAALAAALLGWMFDGLEMGLFPLVAGPALTDLLGTASKDTRDLWYTVATAGFLVGAAAGGVLFGWLGDRLGRVRAMMLSVLTYAIFSGLCAASASAWQLAGLRFLSALGMGGEWALGVALVMELWPNQSRGLLAALIGAAGNLGYLLIAVFGLVLAQLLDSMPSWLSSIGLPPAWVTALTAHSGWRLLMLLGVVPALLALFIQLFVPESIRWQQQRRAGSHSHWAARDLIGVVVGTLGAAAIVYLQLGQYGAPVRAIGTVVALGIVVIGYVYPVRRYLHRATGHAKLAGLDSATVLRRMLLGASLGGVALIGTWAAVQLAPTWAFLLTGEGAVADARSWTQIWSAFGAILGSAAGALAWKWIGRRLTYALLCVGSLASVLAFYQLNHAYGPSFLASVWVVGFWTAAFYGWLPLYLPELFPTAVRATGQGFSYNFGRILAAVGVLQLGNLLAVFDKSYPLACSAIALVYIVGVGLIWLAPETRGQPLPD